MPLHQQARLCKYLTREAEQWLIHGLAKTVSAWLDGCALPRPLLISEPADNPDRKIIFIKGLANVDSAWAQLPRGSVIVVQLQSLTQVDLIWQGAYASNTHVYFFDKMQRDNTIKQPNVHRPRPAPIGKRTWSFRSNGRLDPVCTKFCMLSPDPLVSQDLYLTGTGLT